MLWEKIFEFEKKSINNLFDMGENCYMRKRSKKFDAAENF